MSAAAPNRLCQPLTCIVSDEMASRSLPDARVREDSSRPRRSVKQKIYAGYESGSGAPFAPGQRMLWFFRRQEESLRLETRYDNKASEYVAVVRWPDGRQQTEQFTKGEAFRAWLAAFEDALDGEFWSRDRSPVVLPDGWPDKKPTE